MKRQNLVMKTRNTSYGILEDGKKIVSRFP